MPTFDAYDPAHDSQTDLVAAAFASTAGMSIVDGSIQVVTGPTFDDPSSISFYDGSIVGLGGGAGILITTGDATPALSNTASDSTDTVDNANTSDAELKATVDHVFPGANISDVTEIVFQIDVTDPSAVALKFDIVFGSEEYPEFADSVDIAGVYVNGVDYALFGGSADHPLSVMQSNIDAGYFRDNNLSDDPGYAGIGIEYDGLSVPLQITAPIHLGLNTVKIAIADTFDAQFDSGLFVSGMKLVNYLGSGLTQQVPVDTSGNVQDGPGDQTYVGNGLSNTVTLTSGHDVYDGGAGIDEAVIGYALAPALQWDGAALDLFGTNGEHTEMVNVERVDYLGYLLGLDTSAGGNTFGVAALFQAAANTTLLSPFSIPGFLNDATGVVSQWVAYADAQSAVGGNLGDVAQAILDAYAPGVGDDALLTVLIRNSFGITASPNLLATVEGYIGHVPGIDTMADLFATIALLPQNTVDLDAAHVTGSIVLLHSEYF